jgi:hypothetical protein
MNMEHSLKLRGVNHYFLKKEGVSKNNLIKKYKIENLRNY